MKNNKGITLIVLVITISIMITLAAIGVSYIVGEDGIIGKAEEISKEQEENEKEENEMVISGLEMAVSSVNLEGVNIEGLQQHLGDKYQVLDDIEDENKFLIWDKNNEKMLYINKNIEGEVEEAKDIKIIDSKNEFTWNLNTTTGKINALKYKNKNYEGTVIFPTYVIIENKAHEINNILIHDSYNFSEVILPKNIQTCSTNMFKNCTNLKKVTIGYINNGISAKMFFGCISLENIIFKSQKINRILTYSFENCSALKEISLPESITSIGANAFKGCSSLEEISLPESITNIGAYAFTSCSSLEEISLPESITSIGAYTFKDCINLKRIYIGKNIESILLTAFNGCTVLEKIQIDKTTEEIMEITNIEKILTEEEYYAVGKVYDKNGELVVYNEEE